MKISEVYQVIDEDDYTPSDLLTERIADMRGVIFIPIGVDGVLALAVDVLADSETGKEVDVSDMPDGELADKLKSGELLIPKYWRQAMVMRLGG